jgi:prepilin-type processing-associated H-X9-DG protein
MESLDTMKRMLILCLVIISISVGTLIAVNQSTQLTEASLQKEVKKPLSQLLPADPVLYFNWDGFQNHKEGWQKTVAYESLVDSGLTPTLLEIIKSVAKLGGRQAQDAVDMLLTQGLQRGFTTCVVLQPMEGMPPLPAMYMGFRGGDEYDPVLTQMMASAFRGEVQSGTVGPVKYRSVVIPETPGMQFAWWSQGGHLMVTAGMDVAGNISNILDDEFRNVTQSQKWKSMSTAEDFTVCSTVWFDFSKLVETYGPMPLPLPPVDGKGLVVSDALQKLGLANLQTISSKSGFHGEAVWSESEIVAPGERTGLLAGVNGDSMTLDDLPPLPQASGFFQFGLTDWSGAWDGLLDMYGSLSEVAPPGTLPPAEFGLDFAKNFLGFDVREDLIANLGSRYAVFIDDSQASFMLPSLAVMVEVKDSANLLPTLARCVDKIRELAPPEMVAVEVFEKQGRSFGLVNLGGGMFSLSIALDKHWLILGMSPQIVEATLLRIDGKLPSWKPSDEWLAAFKNRPAEFVSVSSMDVRQGYQAIASILPALYGFGQGMLKQMSKKGMGPEISLDVSAADFPPVALVTQKLFPSITVGTKTDQGVKWTTRSSAPGISVSNAGTMTAAPVLIALLLPAVQQAREAARRTSSKNNLKQLGLGMHNFHDTHSHFPSGTGVVQQQEQLAQLKLKIEDRLSWIYAISPFIDQAPLYNQINQGQAWNSKANAQITTTEIPILLNPGLSLKYDKFPPTEYVGIAGIGKDAPELKLPHKRAGVFGYDRKTRIRDITDGTSNTMMISEASGQFGPWAAGGKSTLRSLTQKPYINGPDGIGGPYTGGCNVLFADGSVRFISENIDPSLFEALSTIAGGEVIGGIP